MTKTTKTKTIFTRITLDKSSMQAVQKIQSILPNYDLNDSVKLLLGLGVSNIDRFLPVLDENGFTLTTKNILLKSKHELEQKKGVTFENSKEVFDEIKFDEIKKYT